MYKMKSIKAEYDLLFEGDNKFALRLKNKFKVEIKWLIFSSEEHFFVHGVILGALKYNDFVFIFTKITPCKYHLKIEDKKDKTFFTRQKIEVLSGNVYATESIFKAYFKFLKSKGIDTL